MAEACNLAASRGGGNRRGTRPRVEIEEMGRDNAGERREKEKERERVAFRGWREIYWDALKFVAFMVRCVGTRSTGAGQRSTLIYASWKTLLTFCQETCVTKYSLEEKLLEVETLRLKRNGVC